jgi:hypothetical protein
MTHLTCESTVVVTKSLSKDHTGQQGHTTLTPPCRCREPALPLRWLLRCCLHQVRWLAHPTAPLCKLASRLLCDCTLAVDSSRGVSSCAWLLCEGVTPPRRQRICVLCGDSTHHVGLNDRARGSAEIYASAIGRVVSLFDCDAIPSTWLAKALELRVDQHSSLSLFCAGHRRRPRRPLTTQHPHGGSHRMVECARERPALL